MNTDANPWVKKIWQYCDIHEAEQVSLKVNYFNNTIIMVLLNTITQYCVIKDTIKNTYEYEVFVCEARS